MISTKWLLDARGHIEAARGNTPVERLTTLEAALGCVLTHLEEQAERYTVPSWGEGATPPNGVRPPAIPRELIEALDALMPAREGSQVKLEMRNLIARAYALGREDGRQGR
jgi:hypothetical protein